MKLTSLHVENYRSLRDVRLDIRPLNVLIGTNGSGKSNLLDVMRILAESMRARNFAPSVTGADGFDGMLCHGAASDEIVIETYYDDGNRYAWRVTFRRAGHGFEVSEELDMSRDGAPTRRILDARSGVAWWASAQVPGDDGFKASVSPTGCALATASADPSFPGRAVAGFVERWGFFALIPALMARSGAEDATRLDPTGSNLAQRLLTLRDAPNGERLLQQILTATRRSLGLPESMEFHVRETDGRVYFASSEQHRPPRRRHPDASDGMLRIMTLMTALFDGPDARVVMLDEPDHHLHPATMVPFASYLREASAHVQLLISTHNTLLLDALGDPEDVIWVRRSDHGTAVERERHPDHVRNGMAASNCKLGRYLYESTRFGAR